MWLNAKRLYPKHYGLILVTAETNAAVDSIMRNLLDLNINAVRIGQRKNVSKDLRVFTLDNIVKDKYGDHKATGEFIQQKTLKEILASVDVVCSTFIDIGSSKFDQEQFSHVLADETSRAMGKHLVYFLLF
jgi:hypothetical protein